MYWLNRPSSTRVPPTLRRRNLKTEVSRSKRIKCFPSTQRLRNLKSQQSLVICVWGKLAQGNHVIIVTSSFSKSSVFKMFSVHATTTTTTTINVNENPAFSNSCGLKSVFRKLRFRDRLVWTVNLTVEIRLRFQLPPIGRAFSWRISVDGKPDRRKKAAFSTSSNWKNVFVTD